MKATHRRAHGFGVIRIWPVIAGIATLAAAAWALLLVPRPALAQAPAAGPEAVGEDLGESIDVTVVNLDVVVRDRAGKLVNDLTRDDFRLLIDGKPVEISNFLSQAGAGVPAAAVPQGVAAAAVPQGSAAAAASAPAAAAAPQRERLNLVVFVDNANLRPFDRNRVLRQLQEALKRMVQPGDRLLMVVHDPRGLQVLLSFADNPSGMDAALAKLAKQSAGGTERDLDLRNTIDEIIAVLAPGCDANMDQAVGLARAHAAKVLADINTTYKDLHHVLSSLDGVTGRKALLYVGDGVATQVGAESFAVVDEVCGSEASSTSNAAHIAFGAIDGTPKMRQVISDANAAGVTMFTLEGSSQASYTSMDGTISGSLARSIDVDRQNSLTSMARETGGRSALNGSDFRHDLQQIAAEIGGSYSLGFAPPPPIAGDHKVKIELRRAGLSATYRDTYRDLSAEQRMEALVAAALIHGMVDNPLGAALRMAPAGGAGAAGGAATAGGAGAVGATSAAAPAAGKSGLEHHRATVPLSIRVPFDKLTFLPRSDGQQHGHLTFYVGTMDGDGALSNVQRAQLPLRLPVSTAGKPPARLLGYDLKLGLEPGRYRVALTVRDDVARVASTVIQEVVVDKAGAATLVAR